MCRTKLNFVYILKIYFLKQMISYSNTSIKHRLNYEAKKNHKQCLYGRPLPNCL